MEITIELNLKLHFVMIRVFWDIRGTGSRREDVVDLGERTDVEAGERKKRVFGGERR